MLHPSHHATLAVVFTSAAAHFILCVTHSKPLFWVYLCYLHLSRILVGNYLHPLKFLMRKISVYLNHPHHPSCSVWSVSRESLCLQSVCVITHSSPIEFVFQAHNFVLEGVIFNAQKCQKLGFWKWLEVSYWEVDQLWSCWMFSGVELGRVEFEGVSCLRHSSLKGVCWRFEDLVQALSSGSMFWCRLVLGFSISTFGCIYWFLMCLCQSTCVVVVHQTWISPLAPDGPENSNSKGYKGCKAQLPVHWCVVTY